MKLKVIMAVTMNSSLIAYGTMICRRLRTKTMRVVIIILIMLHN